MLRFNVVAIFLYLLPALLYLYLTNLSKVDFYQDPLFAIKASILFTMLGFFLGSLCAGKIKFKLRDFSSIIYLNTSKTLISVGIFSVLFQLFKFGIPLFNNDIREYIQQGFFWNVFTFTSMLGLFFSGYYCFVLQERIDKSFKVLILILLFFTFLTGWKGVLINFLFVFFSYFILYREIKISLLVKIGFLFLLIFFGINALRSGIYSISFLELFNYLFYGFENFVRISSNYFSNCAHSIPLFNCQFTYDNSALINPTFNVYTALMPLYADGGVVLVCGVFFIFSFLIGMIKNYKNSFFISFLFYLLHYFFMIAHNGYIFNSGSFIIILFLLFFIDLTRIK